ncbi:MAG TPA: O-methyltransferase [Terriglobales bacterium]
MATGTQQADDVAQPNWTAVDRYINDLLIPPDAALDAALEASRAADLPPINVSPAQGKLLHILVRIQGARRILEIGTLGGYSTIWLARALPDGGRLITLEASPKHAEVARKNIARAGLANVVDLRLGPALDSLKQMAAERVAPFDFIFIDADKPGYPDYLTWTLKLSRPGTLILADNVVRNGKVIDPSNDDPMVQGIRRFNQVLVSERRLTATTIQTVGSKGYDGFTLAIVE